MGSGMQGQGSGETVKGEGQGVKLHVCESLQSVGGH